MAVTGVFSRQRTHSRQSTQLLFLFIVALFVIACIMHLQAGIISLLLGHGSDNDWLFSNYALTLMTVAYGMIILGAGLRYLELRQGPMAVARLYGAVAIQSRSGTKKEKALLAIVDEISIAANQPVTPLWLLPMEKGVNAFVVGSDNSYALVVTRGALELLSQHQQRAMIAHELAHISNDDLPLNMRVLIALSGFLAIHQIAKLAINSGFLPTIIFGYALHIFGMPGVFGANIILMAFTRQREYLADAKAVQFTRNPRGFAEALNIAKRADLSTRVCGNYADEIENFCYLPFGKSKLSNLFVSQPTIDERIKNIDPRYSLRKKIEERTKSRKENPKTVADSLGLEVISNNLTPGLPDEIMFALEAKSAPEAILFALLLYRFDGNKALFIKAMQLKGRHEQAVLAHRSQAMLANQLEMHDTDIISYAANAIRESLSAGEIDELYSMLSSISTLDGEHNLHEFLLLERIAIELGINTEQPSEDSKLSLEESIRFILALIVEASGQTGQTQQARYKKVLSIYGYQWVQPELMNSKNKGNHIKDALITLREQMPAIRKAFVTHCAEIILDDAHVTRTEKNLLELLSSSLKVDKPSLY